MRNQNQLNLTGRERFRQQRSENLVDETDIQDPWYTSNNTRQRRDNDAGNFKKYSQFEYLVESEPPFYGEANPWYATHNPINLIDGAHDSRTFVPTYRDAMLAQGEYTATNMRELFTPKRERLTDPVKRCICAGCQCNKCVQSLRRGVKCTGCSCPNCNCHPIKLPIQSAREHFMETANDNSYATDPRFLVGTAELHFNVGSDVNNITRVYGTVDQRRYYPKLTDYINFGIASTLETPK
jgi:hypothetical protein